jgi:hypothetical protein
MTETRKWIISVFVLLLIITFISVVCWFLLTFAVEIVKITFFVMLVGVALFLLFGFTLSIKESLEKYWWKNRRHK